MTAATHSPLVYKYDHSGRPPVIEAVRTSLQFYLDGQTCIGHDLHPRLGKSAVIQLSALEFQAAGAPFVHVVAPWDSIAGQLVDSSKISENLDRYKAEGWNGEYVSQQLTSINDIRYWERAGGRYTLISTTVHLVHVNRDIVTRAVELAYEQAGKKPVFIVDESHLLGLGRAWSDTTLALVKAGAFVISLTGTSSRRDGSPILGFSVLPEEEWNSKQAVVTLSRGEPYFRDGDGLLVRKEVRERRSQQERGFETSATGVTVSWREGFSNGWLHKVSAEKLSFTVIVNGEAIDLKDISAKDFRANSRNILTSDECCRIHARKGVEELSQWRFSPGTGNTKMLVITVADDSESSKGEDKQANAHARCMRRLINEYLAEDPLLSGQDLVVEICTSCGENGEPDLDARDKLKRFRATSTGRDGKPPIDILIVKGMGLVGLDVPELKVTIDLGAVRKGPMKKQGSTRGCTVWLVDNKPVGEAVVLYPADPENVEFYGSLADCSQTAKEVKVDSAEQFEVEAEVKDRPNAYVVPGSGEKVGYQDEQDRWIDGDYDKLITGLRSRFPQLVVTRKIDIVKMYRGGLFNKELTDEIMAQAKASPGRSPDTSKSVRTVRNLNQELEEKKEDGSFGEMAKELANSVISYKDRPDDWRSFITKLQRKAKIECKISPDTSVARIQDPDIIQRLKDALPVAFAQLAMEFGKQR